MNLIWFSSRLVRQAVLQGPRKYFLNFRERTNQCVLDKDVGSVGHGNLWLSEVKLVPRPAPSRIQAPKLPRVV